MARNADIRLYLVKRFPRMSISSLLHVTKSILRDVKKINAIPDVTLPRGFVVTAPYSHLNDKHDASFVLRTPNKITSEIGDEEFTIASVEAFRDELMVMCIDNTAGINTFENMLLGEDPNFRSVTGYPVDVISEINVKLYSCLVRRHQNRGRRGCDNDYFFDVENPFSNQITHFTVSNITFIETEVHFKITSDDDKVNTILKPDYHLTVPILSDADPKIDSKTYYMLFRNEMEKIDSDWCSPCYNHFVGALDRIITTVCTEIASGNSDGTVICHFGSYRLIASYAIKGSNTTASLLLVGLSEIIRSIDFIDFNGLVSGSILFGNKGSYQIAPDMLSFLSNDFINPDHIPQIRNWINEIDFDCLYVPTIKDFGSELFKETVRIVPKGNMYDVSIFNENGVIIDNGLFKAPVKEPVTTEVEEVPPKVISFWKRLIDKFY